MSVVIKDCVFVNKKCYLPMWMKQLRKGNIVPGPPPGEIFANMCTRTGTAE